MQLVGRGKVYLSVSVCVHMRPFLPSLTELPILDIFKEHEMLPVILDFPGQRSEPINKEMD